MERKRPPQPIVTLQIGESHTSARALVSYSLDILQIQFYASEFGRAVLFSVTDTISICRMFHVPPTTKEM
jgi:hypothetical protein